MKVLLSVMKKIFAKDVAFILFHGDGHWWFVTRPPILLVPPCWWHLAWWLVGNGEYELGPDYPRRNRPTSRLDNAARVMLFIDHFLSPTRLTIMRRRLPHYQMLLILRGCLRWATPFPHSSVPSYSPLLHYQLKGVLFGFDRTKCWSQLNVVLLLQGKNCEIVERVVHELWKRFDLEVIPYFSIRHFK